MEFESLNNSLAVLNFKLLFKKKNLKVLKSMYVVRDKIRLLNIWNSLFTSQVIIIWKWN